MKVKTHVRAGQNTVTLSIAQNSGEGGTATNLIRMSAPPEFGD